MGMQINTNTAANNAYRNLNNTQNDLSKSLENAPRDEPIALYCKSGTRASIAASILQAQGFTDVVIAPGGIDAWEASGNPVERTPA